MVFSDRLYNLPENIIIPGSSIRAEIQILARVCFKVCRFCAFLCFEKYKSQKSLLIKEEYALLTCLHSNKIGDFYCKNYGCIHKQIAQNLLLVGK